MLSATIALASEFVFSGNVYKGIPLGNTVKGTGLYVGSTMVLRCFKVGLKCICDRYVRLNFIL